MLSATRCAPSRTLSSGGARVRLGHFLEGTASELSQRGMSGRQQERSFGGLRRVAPGPHDERKSALAGQPPI
jgi:hypothetical protein